MNEIQIAERKLQEARQSYQTLYQLSAEVTQHFLSARQSGVRIRHIVRELPTTWKRRSARSRMRRESRARLAQLQRDLANLHRLQDAIDATETREEGGR